MHFKFNDIDAAARLTVVMGSPLSCCSNEEYGNHLQKQKDFTLSRVDWLNWKYALKIHIGCSCQLIRRGEYREKLKQIKKKKKTNSLRELSIMVLFTNTLHSRSHSPLFPSKVPVIQNLTLSISFSSFTFLAPSRICKRITTLREAKTTYKARVSRNGNLGKL